jgi:hypothetical protein
MTDTSSPTDSRQMNVQVAARQHTALDWLRMQSPIFVSPLQHRLKAPPEL